MSTQSRSYRSPLREEQAQQTRERILAALGALMQEVEDGDDISMDAIAAAAGVERRTVFRHFATRDALYLAFFAWLNARLGVVSAPQTPAGMQDAIRDGFDSFDDQAAAIRAAIHSKPGREMRAATIPARREAFARCLAPATAGLPPGKRAQVEALAHLLYSAPAWEVLKEYGGLTGPQAGEAAAWALELILSAISPGGTASADTQTPKDRKK